MVGKKTHEQQQRIIEKRVDTSNAGDDFDPRPDLERSKRGLGPVPDATAKTASDPDRPDELFHRGLNQESSQHKRRGRP
jgi:hypothetical protein